MSLLWPVLLGVAACGVGETALLRGDRFWADSSYANALAEYRLSLGEREDDATQARVAHAYLAVGQFEPAREHYDSLLARSPEYTDQAIFDFVAAARRARDRSDRYGMAVAVEAALALRPGLPLDDMTAPLARYYASTGDADRALDFFERALGHADPDSTAALLFEIGELHNDRGDCEEALGFFTAYMDRTVAGEHTSEVRWYVGNCSFQLGRRERQAGDIEAALEHLDRIIGLGVPPNLLDQAWFERGESHYNLLPMTDGGERAMHRDEALRSYCMVLELNRLGAGQLVERAQQRIDEIRFGRGFLQPRPTRACVR